MEEPVMKTLVLVVLILGAPALAGAELPVDLSGAACKVSGSEAVVVEGIEIAGYEGRFWGAFGWNTEALSWELEDGGLMEPGPAVRGAWGGAHVAMAAGEESVEFTFDCAAGAIDRPFSTAGDGSFELSGTYRPGHGGPIREDEIPVVLAARYFGWTDGSAMALLIVLVKSGGLVGAFTLEAGNPGMVMACL